MWQGIGRITLDVHATISDAEWRAFESTIREADFWNLEPYQPRDVLDGANWILEGRRDSAYHVVRRISPDPGPFRRACETLLRLAKLDPDDLDAAFESLKQ